MIALLLLATFSASVPHFKQIGACCCPDSARACYDLQSVALHEFGQQSATWLAKRDSMLVSPAAWALYWPTVRAEADARQIRSQSCSYYDTLTTMQAPTLPGYCYYFTWSTTAGAISCPSNMVKP